ncbi:O-methyltransferase [Wolbachia endosymbiont of Pentidionis agamae]|uniref:O-methyltransferase n=1 Tax=Wolbachia endosymbiont of Pentidionis agamae TaxID=3110435 RepID=UPI002FD6DDDB
MYRDINKQFFYIRNLFTKEHASIEEKYFFQEKQHIQIKPEEGKLLKMLIIMNKITNIVEIGTLYGYSSIWMAEAMQKDGHIYTIENCHEHFEIAQKNFTNFNLDNRITLIKGNALEKLNELSKNAPFDMVFIDADKENYPNYLDWGEQFIKKGGLIVAHNTLLFDTVFLEYPPKGVSKRSWNAMRNFNNRLSNQEKFCSLLVPTEEGITISLKIV